MLDASHITKDEYNEAMKDDVYSRIQSVDNQITQSNNVYSYFVDEVVSQVMSDLQEQKGYTYTQAYNAVYSGGLKIYTTQDSKIQKFAIKNYQTLKTIPIQFLIPLTGHGQFSTLMEQLKTIQKVTSIIITKFF